MNDLKISREDKVVAQLNKALLDIQKAKHLMKGASLFRPLGELFTQADQAAPMSLFEEN